MKRTTALIVAILLLLFSVSAFADDPKFVTIEEWLETKGECGDCLVVVQLQEILNPVLAVAADETGVVNLFSSEGGTIEFNFVYEGIPDYYKGYILVISNPKYNEYEGTIEMAGWKLLRYLPPINRTN